MQERTDNRPQNDAADNEPAQTEMGHLVLTLPLGEQVIIAPTGDAETVIEIIEMGPGRARVSIRAPRSTMIVRGKVRRRLQADRAAKAKLASQKPAA